MRRKGFTVIELLVVMVIIAFLAGILLPAIRKARSKALIDRAKAEMANLASIMTMVKMDVGWYVRLCDLSDASLASNHLDYPVANGSNLGNDLNGTYTLAYTDGTNDTTDCESELTEDHNWDGPYTTFQPNSVYSSNNGSHPTDGTGSWDNLSIRAPYGTPLDPWGHTYLVAYNENEKVMIIYSAGPNGKIETNKGATTPSSNSDDILYKFR